MSKSIEEFAIQLRDDKKRINQRIRELNREIQETNNYSEKYKLKLRVQNLRSMIKNIDISLNEMAGHVQKNRIVSVDSFGFDFF